MGGKIPPTGTNDLPVEDEDLSTQQEAVPWPFFAGEQLIGIRWLDEATNQLTQKSKTPIGKK